MTLIITNSRERTRFMRFLVVGLIGAVVDFSTFNIFNGLLHFPGVIAQAISFTAALISNFTWNRYWTYPDSRSKSISAQLVQFTVVNLIGLLIRTPIYYFMEDPYKALYNRLTPFPTFVPSFVTTQFLGHNTALATAVLVVLLWNFFINRYWTYNDVK